MKRLFCILCFLISSKAFAEICDSMPVAPATPYGGSLFVGNAGEGFCIDGQLILRDLFEYGNGQNAQIGSHADDVFIQKLQSAQIKDFLNAGELTLLARKLTDLQKLSPELGLYVVEAITMHRWLLIDAAFKEVPEDPSGLALPRRIPLANRYLDIIRVRQASWRELTGTQRIAMIVHEAVSSLMKPECDGKGFCFQNSGKIRDIVGVAFENTADPFYTLSPDLENSLQIPARTYRQTCNHQGNFIKASIRGSSLELSDSSNKQVRDYFFKAFCSLIEQYDEDPRLPSSIHLSLYRNAYKAVPAMSYLTRTKDVVYRQRFVVVTEIGDTLNLDSSFVMRAPYKSFCEEGLKKFADEWYAYNMDKNFKAPVSCEH